MSEALFDLSAEYESMLNQGIRLSGEGMAFFLEGRVQLLRRRISQGTRVRRILDFGCGLGDTSHRLAELFPGASVTGADTSRKILAAARERNPAVTFVNVDELASHGSDYDLCYVNGVFHHIPPAERPAALALIRARLAPGGQLALFENNPWNPGTRMVMARIPFDRDAQTLSLPASMRMLRAAGFEIRRVDSLFFFPRMLAALRFAEPWLSWTRLGAQYLVLGARR